MSHTKLGMNPTTARNVSVTLSNLSNLLESVENEVKIARVMSLNPLENILTGGLMLNPASIGLALSASTDLANARTKLEYFALLLTQEAVQQEQVSNSLTPLDPGWYAPAPTAKKPDDISIGDEFWDEFGTFANIYNYLGIVEGAFETLGDIWTKAWNDAPPWAKDVIKWGDNLGKWVPFVGMPIAWGGVVADWDEDYVWGNTRNIIGASIATIEVICLIPPLTPAAPVVGAVGLVWDIFDTVWDLGDEFWW